MRLIRVKADIFRDSLFYFLLEFLVKEQHSVLVFPAYICKIFFFIFAS